MKPVRYPGPADRGQATYSLIGTKTIEWSGTKERRLREGTPADRIDRGCPPVYKIPLPKDPLMKGATHYRIYRQVIPPSPPRRLTWGERFNLWADRYPKTAEAVHLIAYASLGALIMYLLLSPTP